MLFTSAVCAAAILANPGYRPAAMINTREAVTLETVAAQTGISEAILYAANPQIAFQQAASQFLIPARLENSNRLQLVSFRSKAKTYTVVSGDNDWKISAKIGISRKELREANPSVDWRKIKPGQKLKVPSETKPAAAAKKPTQKAVNSPGGSYKVVEGDNDWKIAAKLKITRAKLKELNPGVEWTKLKIGSSLKTGVAAAPKMQTAAAKSIRTPYVAIAKDDVSVRESGRADARRRTLVKKGEIAKVLDRTADWYKLKFETGLVGWVRGDMLKSLSTTAASASKASVRKTAVVAAKTPVKAPVKNAPSAIASGIKNAGSLIATATSNLGIRYRWGGTSRSGFDCSGFTSHVFARHGIRIPRTSIEQSQFGSSVSKDSLKTGDLVFFKTGRSVRVNHVGIYMGNGQFIHASSGGGRVKTDTLMSGYYSSRYAGARRVNGSAKIRIDREETDKEVLPDPRKITQPGIDEAKKEDEQAMQKAREQIGGSDVLPETTERPTRVQPGLDVTGR